jgi:hypothetical protein
VLHYDLKELVLSVGGYRYVVFVIDEFSRFVFIEFIKLKSEADAAVKRCIAAFNATVSTPIDEAGHPLPRPTVRVVHGDREGIRVVFSRKWCCFFPYAFKCIFMHSDAFSPFSLHFIQMHSSPPAWYCILLHLYAFIYDAF